MNPSSLATFSIADIAALLAQRIAEDQAAKSTQQMPEQGIVPRLLTAKQAGDYIGRSEQAIRHMIHQRQIPVVRTGRCVRVDRKDLDTWIANNRV